MRRDRHNGPKKRVRSRRSGEEDVVSGSERTRRSFWGYASCVTCHVHVIDLCDVFSIRQLRRIVEVGLRHDAPGFSFLISLILVAMARTDTSGQVFTGG